MRVALPPSWPGGPGRGCPSHGFGPGWPCPPCGLGQTTQSLPSGAGAEETTPPPRGLWWTVREMMQPAQGAAHSRCAVRVDGRTARVGLGWVRTPAGPLRPRRGARPTVAPCLESGRHLWEKVLRAKYLRGAFPPGLWTEPSRAARRERHAPARRASSAVPDLQRCPCGCARGQVARGRAGLL